MELRIKDLSPGQEAVLAGYTEVESGYKRRLLAMGLTKGTKVKLLKIAPLGDPVEVEVRGFNLSLRKAEADALILEKDV